MVHGTTRIPCVRPSKLAVYPTAECIDDAHDILEYRTSPTSSLVSAQIPDFTRALLTLLIKKHTKMETDAVSSTFPEQFHTPMLIIAADMLQTVPESPKLSNPLTYANPLRHI